MVKQIKFRLPNGKYVESMFEDTLHAKGLIHALQEKNILEVNNSYYIEDTFSHIKISLDSTFQNNDYTIFEDKSLSDEFDEESIINIGPITTPKYFHQLGILVLDGSGSMADSARGGVTKSEAVNIAVRELLTRFKVSNVVKNFSFAVVSFDTTAAIMTPITEAESIDDNSDYNPMIGHGGGTNIYSGLQIAEKLANDFLSESEDGGADRSVLILLLSDGMCFDPIVTKSVANSIKNGIYSGRTTLCCTLFSEIGKTDNNAKDLLREITSDKIKGFKEVYDAETLRNFFMASIKSASGVSV